MIAKKIHVKQLETSEQWIGFVSTSNPRKQEIMGFLQMIPTLVTQQDPASPMMKWNGILNALLPGL